MQLDHIKRRLKRDLLKNGLILITTRKSSRDYWNLGRYSVMDSCRLLIERDIDIYDLARKRDLLPAEESI